MHPFDVICEAHQIEHRLTQFRHPWTNGQVEVTNRILKKYTTKAYLYEDLKELKKHMMSFVLYYNHQRKLKSLKYQTPFDIVCNAFEIEPVNFKQNPNHMLPELNIYLITNYALIDTSIPLGNSNFIKASIGLESLA